MEHAAGRRIFVPLGKRRHGGHSGGRRNPRGREFGSYLPCPVSAVAKMHKPLTPVLVARRGLVGIVRNGVRKVPFGDEMQGLLNELRPARHERPDEEQRQEGISHARHVIRNVHEGEWESNLPVAVGSIRPNDCWDLA